VPLHRRANRPGATAPGSARRTKHPPATTREREGEAALPRHQKQRGCRVNQTFGCRVPASPLVPATLGDQLRVIPTVVVMVTRQMGKRTRGKIACRRSGATIHRTPATRWTWRVPICRRCRPSPRSTDEDEACNRELTGRDVRMMQRDSPRVLADLVPDLRITMPVAGGRTIDRPQGRVPCLDIHQELDSRPRRRAGHRA